jgi:hypothetical protein
MVWSTMDHEKDHRKCLKSYWAIRFLYEFLLGLIYRRLKSVPGQPIGLLGPSKGRRPSMRKPALSLSILLGAAILFGTSSILWAQTPPISIDLRFEKDSFAPGDPVLVSVRVRNKSNAALFISQGFQSKVYSPMKISLIDPEGRLLIARSKEKHREVPDAPPLAFSVAGGERVVRVAPCELLPENFSGASNKHDLRDHYDMKLPGTYKAKVQISAMVWTEKCCEGNNCDATKEKYKLLLLESEPITFSIK